MEREYLSYKGYTVEELLEDDFFIQSMINPTPESEVFWEAIVGEHIVSPQEYEKAYGFLRLTHRPKKIMSVRDRGALWAAIEIRNKENLMSRIRRRNMYLLGIAATFLLLVVSFVSVQLMRREAPQDILALANDSKPVVSNPNSIQLIVSGEKVYEMEEKTAEIVLNEKGEIQMNSELLEDGAAVKGKQTDTKFNQLIIPYGKQSRLTLPDGTTMAINSGSRVIFPEVFRSDEREIFVDGEVYLDVKHNPKCPFIVRTNKMKVEVLGTSFNISAYEDEAEQSVVLVSGLVAIRTEDNRETRLSPNQKMTYSNDTHTVSIVDVNQYTTWKEGYLMCKDEALPYLMRKLSRYYGRTIECDPFFLTYSANGKLDLKGDFESVMNGLKEIFPIDVEYHENTCRIVKRSD